MPGSFTSYVYFALPVTLSGPSKRGRGLPTCSNCPQLSRSHGLRSPCGTSTSIVCGLAGMPAFAVNLTVGSAAFG